MKKINFKITTLFIVVILTTFLFVNCSDDDSVSEEETTEEETVIDDPDFVATDWTTETHSKDTDANFTEVFDDNAVKRLDIVVTNARWKSMLADMTSMYGTFGTSSSPGGGTSFSDDDPLMVPAEVFYNGKEWYKVGIRFKGNSSLQSSWQSGILKLSFKLDFDEYEDDYPQIKNQRFYGFKKLSLKNNYDDESFIREKVAADVFKSAGLAVSHTAFYKLYVDSGDGPVYFGLYTMVEEVDDTLIDNQFSSDKGNLYKPEDTGANFANGTFNEAGFEKKTNEDDADWTDIKALFTALHSTTRTSSPATWRTNLETILDVDTFLNYLAVNTVIQNWDTYGVMPHNYYLYNNPDNNKLTWIPWDNNEALQTGKQGGALNLNFSNLSGSWPLISYLYADSEYKAKYNTYVKNATDNSFKATTMQALYTKYAALIESAATSETKGYTYLESTGDFSSAISILKSHATSRATAVSSYLN